MACTQSVGLGFGAVAYFVFVVVLGGLILPTVIIGILAISFERAWNMCVRPAPTGAPVSAPYLPPPCQSALPKRFSEEMIMKGILDLLIKQMEETLPEWWSLV
jgi:hypothetical protein